MNLYLIAGDEPDGAAGRSHLVMAPSEPVALELVEKIAPHFRIDEVKVLKQELAGDDCYPHVIATVKMSARNLGRGV
jgi:hypothetical protein